MVKRVFIISLITVYITAAIFTVVMMLASAAPAQVIIEYYDREVPEGLEYIAGTTAVFNTDYWHYSGGYWLDGSRKEARIYDGAEAFWANPELYYDRPGMNIKAEGILPDSVKKCLNDGNDIVISVKPIKHDSVNLINAPKYFFENDCVYIVALPYFKVAHNILYTDYILDLDNHIPIVQDGYGWNVYSIYRNGVHIGELGSSFEKDGGAIEFSELYDKNGKVRSDKVFDVVSAATGAVTRAGANEINIGNGEFNSAGSVGMWFQYVFDVRFYRTPPIEIEPTPSPSPTPAPRPSPAPSPAPTPAPVPLPDLSVTGFRDYIYLTSSVARSYVKVKNVGFSELQNISLIFYDGVATHYKNVSLTPGEEKEMEFIWFTPESACTLQAYAEINPGRAVDESDYANNRRNFEIGINPPPSDLSISSVIPPSYPAGKPVLTLVEVRNAGGRDFSGADMVEVNLSIPSVSYNTTTKINIGVNQAQTVPFYWTAPLSPGLFEITAEVNPSRVINESNYSNNILTIPAEAVINPNPSYGCNVTRREWVETRLVRREYSNVYGSDGVQLFLPDGKPARISTSIYEEREFYAEVTLSARLAPDLIKSGYGLECEVTAGLRTNYDRPSAIIPLQDVYAYLPTDGYATAIQLEPVPGAANRWRFPVNASSVAGARVQYVPLNWPDGSAYLINLTARGAQSPGGAMCASVSARALVSGNMYEDDYTAPLY